MKNVHVDVGSSIMLYHGQIWRFLTTIGSLHTIVMGISLLPDVEKVDTHMTPSLRVEQLYLHSIIPHVVE